MAKAARKRSRSWTWRSTESAWCPKPRCLSSPGLRHKRRSGESALRALSPTNSTTDPASAWTSPSPQNRSRTSCCNNRQHPPIPYGTAGDERRLASARARASRSGSAYATRPARPPSSLPGREICSSGLAVEPRLQRRYRAIGCLPLAALHGDVLLLPAGNSRVLRMAGLHVHRADAQGYYHLRFRGVHEGVHATAALTRRPRRGNGPLPRGSGARLNLAGAAAAMPAISCGRPIVVDPRSTT